MKVSTKGGFGSSSVYVDGVHAGHVSKSKADGKFVAIHSGKVLGRFDTKDEAVTVTAQKGTK